MLQLPLVRPSSSPLVRTDFSDDQAWAAVATALSTPSAEGFLAGLDVVDDPAFAGAAPADLLAAVPAGVWVSVLFVVDTQTLTDPEQPVLAVRGGREPGDSFRVVPGEVWSVENNLSLANMDWADFAGALGADGVYRGF